MRYKLCVIMYGGGRAMWYPGRGSFLLGFYYPLIYLKHFPPTCTYNDFKILIKSKQIPTCLGGGHHHHPGHLGGGHHHHPGHLGGATTIIRDI